MMARMRRVPRLLWLLVALAFAHGCAWAVLTPAFQGADEIVHMGYVEYVAETGKAPTRNASGAEPATDMREALDAIPWSTTGKPSWSEGASNRLERRIDRTDDERANRVNPLAAGYQANNPPLYPYLMAVPYRVAGLFGADILERLLVVRLSTAFLGAFAVLFIGLLLRELFPRHRWAWYTGALAVALQPVFGWLIGSVNNDIPVLVAGAALLWLIARTYRRGLTVPSAVALGAVVALGMLSKVSAYGLAAVLGWSLLFLVWHERRRWRTVVPLALLALAIAVLPAVVVSMLRDVQSAVADNVTGNEVTTAKAPPALSPREFVSYLWQFWLPKLPFMDEQFPGYPQYAVWETYIQGFAGRFGWFQYGFGLRTNKTVLWVLVGIVVAAVVALVRRRRAVADRWPLLVALVGGAVGYAVMVNLAGYRYRLDTAGENFEQTRYLFPMLGLYAAAVGAATLAFPARWRRWVFAFVAAATVLHVVAAWGLTISRYYV
ncbi:glycosyltransferase family 39 protein [Patulibacter sp. S7RM1-6]